MSNSAEHCVGIAMDFSKNKIFSRFVRLSAVATAYLDGMLRVATSADQRASSLAGMFTAAATALYAG